MKTTNDTTRLADEHATLVEIDELLNQAEEKSRELLARQTNSFPNRGSNEKTRFKDARSKIIFQISRQIQNTRLSITVINDYLS